jgi:hypothetical protein
MHNPFSTYSDTQIMHNPGLCKMSVTDLHTPKCNVLHFWEVQCRQFLTQKSCVGGILVSAPARKNSQIHPRFDMSPTCLRHSQLRYSGKVCSMLNLSALTFKSALRSCLRIHLDCLMAVKSNLFGPQDCLKICRGGHTGELIPLLGIPLAPTM